MSGAGFESQDFLIHGQSQRHARPCSLGPWNLGWRSPGLRRAILPSPTGPAAVGRLPFGLRPRWPMPTKGAEVPLILACRRHRGNRQRDAESCRAAGHPLLPFMLTGVLYACQVDPRDRSAQVDWNGPRKSRCRTVATPIWAARSSAPRSASPCDASLYVTDPLGDPLRENAASSTCG